MKTSFRLLLAAALLGGFTRAALACEACALYLATHTDRPGFTTSVAHQFTRLGSLWAGDHQVANPIDQYLDSHITQVSLGYSSGRAWQAQVTLPYVDRRFLRPDHARIEQGRESGFGDATLAARYRLWQAVGPQGDEFAVSVIGGVEFGTGDTGRLRPASHVHHHFTPSGIHEHDLAVGSGSTDWLVGADAGWKRGRYFAHAQWQRLLRRPGAFAYRFADETTWEIAAGRYLLISHARTLAIQALASGDHKGLDAVAGVPQDDTGSSVRYLGARVTATMNRRLETDVAVELPMRIRTTDTMIAPDYRVRAACNWRF